MFINWEGIDYLWRNNVYYIIFLIKLNIGAHRRFYYSNFITKKPFFYQ